MIPACSGIVLVLLAAARRAFWGLKHSGRLSTLGAHSASFSRAKTFFTSHEIPHYSDLHREVVKLVSKLGNARVLWWSFIWASRWTCVLLVCRFFVWYNYFPKYLFFKIKSPTSVFHHGYSKCYDQLVLCSFCPGFLNVLLMYVFSYSVMIVMLWFSSWF